MEKKVKQKIIAVTGGTGFIGREIVNLHINKGDCVRLLSRTPKENKSKLEYFNGDLTKSNSDLSKFLDGVDILYHCAGERTDDSKMTELHVNGTKRLISAGRGKIGRWIQLSSVGVYGLRREGIVDENSLENPFTVYEHTKALSDNVVRNSGLPFVILRPSIVFGEKMPNQSLNKLIRSLRNHLFFFIGEKNKSIVNYVHVEDVAEAMIYCGSCETALGEVFNLSQSTSVENMINSFLSATNSKNLILRLPENFVRFLVSFFGRIPIFPLTKSRVDALTGACVYKSDKLKKILKFEFQMSLEERFISFAKEK